VDCAQLKVSEFACESGYPIEIESFLFNCESNTCTFGTAANFTGWFSYANLTSEYAYASAEVSYAGLSYPLFTDQLLDLCGNYSVVYGGTCPYDDGDYIVEFDFTIPTKGGMDWFFTGYNLKSKIHIYDENKTNVLGQCTATVKTTTSSTTTVADRKYRNPSAAVASVGLLAAIASFLVCKAVTKGDKNEFDDKKDELLYGPGGAHGPDEIERARSAFAEELPWPKSRRQQDDMSSESSASRGHMA